MGFLWQQANQLLPSTWSTLLTGELSASFRSLNTALFSLGLSHWKRFWLVCTARSAIQMYRNNTIQYNTSIYFSDALHKPLSAAHGCCSLSLAASEWVLRNWIQEAPRNLPLVPLHLIWDISRRSTMMERLMQRWLQSCNRVHSVVSHRLSFVLTIMFRT